MIDFTAASYAVLSHDSLQHLQHFAAADLTGFNQADDHPHVFDYAQVGFDRLVLDRADLGKSGSRSRGATALTLGVEHLLLFLMLAVVGNTPLGGLLPPMRFPAAKGTSQVPAAGIARMGEKKDPAMPAAGQASSQPMLGSQNRAQQEIVLQDQTADLSPTIPIYPELEIPCDRDCRNPKLSLRMLRKLKTPSSYPTDTLVSRVGRGLSG
jgi:hypothetical protein